MTTLRASSLSGACGASQYHLLCSGGATDFDMYKLEKWWKRLNVYNVPSQIPKDNLEECWELGAPESPEELHQELLQTFAG